MLFHILATMPKPAKIAGPFIFVLGIAFLLFRFYGPAVMTWFLVGCLILAVIFGLFLLVLKAGRRKKSAAFSKNMGAAGAATPGGVSSAEAMAKLDDMRRKFDEGVQKFASAGKDLYDMPWYMVVGEPGSGKTEAIRRSSIGFPPGLQDEFQGVGGTINMNWWFTNQAVILDLAGRLVFEDLKPGATNEWREFLNLLARGRPNAPVNGMLLVIPADSLIRDNEEAIKKKAQKLAEQFEIVQRTLDVRFPVFVLITKCDLINGFREFFEDLATPAEQHQIFGWSNRQDIDEPLNLGQIAEHMRSVISRLLDRRQSVLANPEPMKDLSERRMDEVDSLYAFPHSFRRLLPAMRHYLETIFVAGEWSARPLFLRGIYFTSSMREGAALDDELGKALGVDPSALPEGRLWDRDRPFFLRDVFLKKIFPEQGLVTRASNVRQQTQRRRRALLVTGTVGVSALILLTFLGGHSLEKSIGAEKKIWDQIATAVDMRDYAPVPEEKRADLETRIASWAPIITPNPQGGFDYRGERRVPELKPAIKLATLHRKLALVTAKPLEIPLAFRIFRPFDRSLETDRRVARRVFFELSVVRPLLLGARAALAATPPEDWTEDHTLSLQMLLRLEAEVVGAPYEPGALESPYADLTPLLAAAAGGEAADAFAASHEKFLQDSLEWSYERRGGRGEWPPPWAVLGEDLKINQPLRQAVEAFVRYCATPPALAQLVDQIKKVGELGVEVKKFRAGPETAQRAAERDYLAFVTANLEGWTSLQNLVESRPAWAAEHAKLNESFSTYQAAYGALTTAYQRIAFIQQADLDHAYTNTVANAMTEARKRFGDLELSGGRAAAARNLLQAKLDEAKAEVNDAPAAGGSRRRGREEAEDAGPDDLLGRVNALMTAAVDKMRSEYLNPRIVEGLKEFRLAWKETEGQVQRQARILDHLMPPPVGDALLFTGASWAEVVKRLSPTQIPVANKAVADLADALKTNLSAYLEAEKATLKDTEREAFSALVRRTEKAIYSTKLDRSFNAGLTERMDRWKRLSGNSTEDRAVLLALAAEAFQTDYLFSNSKDAEEDYASQYWALFSQHLMRMLADDVLKSVQAILPQLRSFAVFPLDLYREGASELAAADLYKAAELFQRIRPSPTPAEKKTVGDGAITRPHALVEQIQRLRQLGLERSMGWLAPALDIMDALPPDEKSARVCTVWLLPETTQQELLTSNNRGQVNDDGVRFIWPYLELAGDSSQPPRRSDTFAAKPVALGRVKFPGPAMELRFFKHRGDPDASAKVVAGTGAWSPLQWLFRFGGERNPTEPRKWRVRVSLKDDNNHERLLWLELEFETPLPELKNWPDQRKM